VSSSSLSNVMIGSAESPFEDDFMDFILWPNRSRLRFVSCAPLTRCVAPTYP
jgi:hypothetical protein